jgi:hypothetical protein
MITVISLDVDPLMKMLCAMVIQADATVPVTYLIMICVATHVDIEYEIGHKDLPKKPLVDKRIR